MASAAGRGGAADDVNMMDMDDAARQDIVIVKETGKFIINDKVRTLTDAPRCSEELPLYPAEIKTRILSKQFIEFEWDTATEDKQEVQEFIEQHCRLDLDGDGYEEPYIVTLHVETEKVVRIVADFEPDDVKYLRETRDMPVQVAGIDPMTGIPVSMEVMHPQEVVTGIAAINRGSYFVAYKFMPGIDGGFHGTGLGLLLGDISDTINTIINVQPAVGDVLWFGRIVSENHLVYSRGLYPVAAYPSTI
jgi:hypothetical protein